MGEGRDKAAGREGLPEREKKLKRWSRKSKCAYVWCVFDHHHGIEVYRSIAGNKDTDIFLSSSVDFFGIA